MIEFEKYLGESVIEEFLDCLNVEAHDLSALDLDFVILKAKEFGFIESYELSRLDESDIVYLFIAEMICAFDNNKGALIPLRANFVNIKNFTTTKKAKQELLYALYNLQNGVIGGRDRTLIVKWRNLGLSALWHNHVDRLITHLKSIHETDDYFSSDRNYLQSVIDDVSNPNSSLDDGKKNVFTRRSLFVSIALLCSFFICIALLASIQKLSVQSQRFYLNFIGSDAIAVVTHTRMLHNNMVLSPNEHLYRHVVTFITASGQEVIGSIDHVYDYRQVPAVGSQIWVVYERENPYNLTLRSPYVNAYKVIAYLVICLVVLGFVMLVLRFFVLTYVKSQTIKSAMSFCVLTIAIFAATYIFIFENRYIFYRFVGARPLSEFSYVDSRLVKKSNGRVYTGLVKTQYGTQTLISSYRRGRLEGLSVSYEKDVIRMLGNYTDGYLNGMYIRYDSTGSPLEYALYEHGRKNGFYREYDEFSDKIVYEGIYQKGLKEGAFRTFYSDGKIRKVERYKHDMLNGTVLEFYRNGQVKNELNYDNGVLNGRCQSFDENGIPTVDVYIKKGMYFGTFVHDIEDLKQNPMPTVLLE